MVPPRRGDSMTIAVLAPKLRNSPGADLAATLWQGKCVADNTAEGRPPGVSRLGG